MPTNSSCIFLELDLGYMVTCSCCWLKAHFDVLLKGVFDWSELAVFDPDPADRCR